MTMKLKNTNQWFRWFLRVWLVPIPYDEENTVSHYTSIWLNERGTNTNLFFFLLDWLNMFFWPNDFEPIHMHIYIIISFYINARRCVPSLQPEQWPPELSTFLGSLLSNFTTHSWWGACKYLYCSMSSSSSCELSWMRAQHLRLDIGNQPQIMRALHECLMKLLQDDSRVFKSCHQWIHTFDPTCFFQWTFNNFPNIHWFILNAKHTNGVNPIVNHPI